MLCDRFGLDSSSSVRLEWRELGGHWSNLSRRRHSKCEGHAEVGRFNLGRACTVTLGVPKGVDESAALVAWGLLTKPLDIEGIGVERAGSV